jgi:hypothetical protein
MTKAIVILGAALLGAAGIPALAQTAPAAKAVEMVASAPGTATKPSTRPAARSP